jgi:hypothetical protein
MPELAQVKATIPKDLKRKAFATFALHDEKFNRWLERELRAFIRVCPTFYTAFCHDCEHMSLTC